MRIHRVQSPGQQSFYVDSTLTLTLDNPPMTNEEIIADAIRRNAEYQANKRKPADLTAKMEALQAEIDNLNAGIERRRAEMRAEAWRRTPTESEKRDALAALGIL